MLDGTVGNLGRSHVGGQGESEILISPLRAIDQSPLAHEQALDEVAYTTCDFFISLTFDAPMPTPDRAERSLAREPERRDTESGSLLKAMEGWGCFDAQTGSEDPTPRGAAQATDQVVLQG